MNRYPDIEDKLMSLEEAVRRFIKDGSQIALGGFTVSRNPMAITYEIIRQGIRNLHLVCHSQGQSFDLLIGAGAVKRVEVAYGAMGRFASTCVRFRKAAERGEVVSLHPLPDGPWVFQRHELDTDKVEGVVEGIIGRRKQGVTRSDDSAR